MRSQSNATRAQMVARNMRDLMEEVGVAKKFKSMDEWLDAIIDGKTVQNIDPPVRSENRRTGKKR